MFIIQVLYIKVMNFKLVTVSPAINQTSRHFTLNSCHKIRCNINIEIKSLKSLFYLIHFLMQLNCALSVLHYASVGPVDIIRIRLNLLLYKMGKFANNNIKRRFRTVFCRLFSNRK